MTSSPERVLCFVGKAGSGKDTAADAISKALPDLWRFRWADVLKEVCCMVYGWDLRLLNESSPYKESVPHIDCQESGEFFQYQCPGPDGVGMSRREVLQVIGTEGFRGMVSDDTWLRAAHRRIEEIREFADGPFAEERVSGWLNTDTRFPNEAEYARKNFETTIVRVERVGRETLTSHSQHASELAMDQIEVDAVIRVADGDLFSLEAQAVAIATTFFNRKG